MRETWRSFLPEVFSNVFVSSAGRVQQNGKTLSTRLQNEYLYVYIVDANNKSHAVAVHRLVAFLFCPVYLDIPIREQVVNHCDGVKTHNQSDNLEWVTSAENAQHAQLLRLRLRDQQRKSQIIHPTQHHLIKGSFSRINIKPENKARLLPQKPIKRYNKTQQRQKRIAQINAGLPKIENLLTAFMQKFLTTK